MSMVLLRGTIDYIGPTEQKTEKLSVMKFVLGTDTGPIEIEVANKSIEFFLKGRKVGDKIGVNIEIQGRKSFYNGKDTYFSSLRHINSFPIFTRGDDSPSQSSGVGASNGGYDSSYSNGSYQGTTGNGSQGYIPPSPEDDLPF